MIELLDVGMDARRTVQQSDLKRKRHEEIWVEMHVQLIQWQGSPAILSTMSDITESRLKQLAIKEEA